MENVNITNQTTTTATPSEKPQVASQMGATHASQQQESNQNGNLGLRTFTQEQLDAIIARERSKATKGLFTAEQMAEKDAAIQTLTTERDTEKANSAKLKAQVDAYEHEKYLAGKGVPADMLEFYAFKIGKLVTDKKTFEQAAEEFIKENPPSGTVRMSTGGNVGAVQNQAPAKVNDLMNALIRGAK